MGVPIFEYENLDSGLFVLMIGGEISCLTSTVQPWVGGSVELAFEPGGGRSCGSWNRHPGLEKD